MFSMRAIVYREEDGRYTAEIPSCPGCAASGHTREEALDNLREAAELYFEDSGEAELDAPRYAEMERFAL